MQSKNHENPLREIKNGFFFGCLILDKCSTWPWTRFEIDQINKNMYLELLAIIQKNFKAPGKLK